MNSYEPQLNPRVGQLKPRYKEDMADVSNVIFRSIIKVTIRT